MKYIVHCVELILKVLDESMTASLKYYRVDAAATAVWDRRRVRRPRA
jgi:hypothetical protein